MKKIILITALLVLAGTTIGLTSCKKEKENVIPATVDNTVTLTAYEQQSLQYTREEEKMARDVYKALLGKWGNLSFLSNIISSEQKHMDAIKTQLDKYQITDPIQNDAEGVFTNKDIQKLYNDFVSEGSKSETDALLVGLTIEDMDIYDLQEAVKQVQQEDIKTVYKNLTKASKNHMREFYTQLTNKGGTYTPKYISQQEYTEIVNSPKEHGHE